MVSFGADFAISETKAKLVCLSAPFMSGEDSVRLKMCVSNDPCDAHDGYDV